MRTTKSITFSRPAQAVLLSYVSSILFSLIALQATALTTTTENPVHCAFTPHLSCTDVQSGTPLWNNSHYSDPDNFSSTQSQLFISHSTTSSSYDLYSGQQIWQISSQSDTHYFYPILSGNSVYLARSDGVLEKRQADSGHLIWSRNLSDGWVYPPLIQHDLIITGGQNRTIWVLNEQTGKTLDSLALSQELVAPLFQQNEQFIGSTFDGKLSAFHFDRQSGKTEATWQVQLDAPAFSYVADSEHFIAADMGGTLSSLIPESGQIRWQYTAHQNALFWNTLYRGNLLSLGESGSLSILDINTGEPQKHLQFDHQYIQAPIVQGEHIALYDTTGAVQHLTPDALSANKG